MTQLETARRKHRPENIKYLFVAEAPPKSNSGRFFYFEDVTNGDSLFLETMKCLYPEQVCSMHIKSIRKTKSFFLERFRNDGFYLIDSLDKPFEQNFSSKQKETVLRSRQSELLLKIKQLCNNETIVILIAATVFRANFLFLVEKGINVANTQLIDFPGSGGQKRFREKMAALLKEL